MTKPRHSDYLVSLADAWITEERGAFMTHQGSAWAVLDAATAFDDAVLARADRIRHERREAFAQTFAVRASEHGASISHDVIEPGDGAVVVSGTWEVDA